MTQTPVLRDEGDPNYRSAESFLREAAKQAADSEQVVAGIFNEHILGWAPQPVQRRLRRAIAIAQAGSAASACRFEDFLAALDMPRFAMDAFVDEERRRELRRHMDGLLAASRGHAGALDFFRFLQTLDEENEQRLAGLAEGRSRSHKAHVAAITLASAAHVKGLEFGHVLLPYLKQGVFPDARGQCGGRTQPVLRRRHPGAAALDLDGGRAAAQRVRAEKSLGRKLTN